MSNIKQDISNLIAGVKSYVAYRKIIRDNYPLIDQKLEDGPYDRYAENLYLFLEDMVERPKCECGTILKYIDRSLGYGKFCSTKCSANSTKTIDQRLHTTNSQSIEHRSAIINKRKQTMLDKYGVEHALKHPEFINRAKQSLKSLDQQTISNTRKNTILNKYGVDNSWDIPGLKEKIQQTNLKKYGVNWALQRPELIDARKLANRLKFYNSLNDRVPDCTPMFSFDEFTNVGQKYKWKCNKCLSEFIDHIDDGSDPMCNKCYPSGKSSSIGERELVNWLISIGVTNIIQNDTSILYPKEIDILLPEYNIGIEYNGLYFHSEKKIKDNKYHQKKFLDSREKGIRLIQIFSDEWETKQSIVKSRLLHILNKSCTVTYARKCILKPISKNEYAKFLDNTHIQGSCITKIRIGAFYREQLVAVMGFGQNRSITKNKGWELLRFAASGNIPGIAGKLFSYFIKNYQPPSVFSYCDLRWGTGKVYESIGMIKESITTPGYWYTKDGVHRINRATLMKYKLLKMGHDNSLTGPKIIESLGYYKLFDAGNYKFVWNNPQI